MHFVTMFLSQKRAAENEVQNRDVSNDDLSLNQCRSLRRHNAAEMIRGLSVQVRYQLSLLGLGKTSLCVSAGNWHKEVLKKEIEQQYAAFV